MQQVAGPTTDEQAAIRAALGLTPDGATPNPEPARTLVAAWAEDVGLGPGLAVAGTTEDLFRVFEDWCRRAAPGQPVPHHWTFAMDLRDLALTRKHRVGPWWMHSCNTRAAQLIRDARAALGTTARLDWTLASIPPYERGRRRGPGVPNDEYFRTCTRWKRSQRARATARRQALAARHLVRPD